MKTNLWLFSLLLSFLYLGQNFPQTAVPEWAYDATIYEVNIRQFTEEGTFQAFETHLPRLKELGVDIIWLMPIHPIGELNRKGTLGSYYSVRDYKAVNPEFGTMNDFKDLVNKIHSMGMYVIIDWVANHTSWDNVWIEQFPEFYTKDKNGNFVPPVDDWTDVIDLNYENKELWDEMTDALKFWISEYNIDGYRCDVAGMVPFEFWEYARPQLDELKSVFMLAEWDTPEMHNSFDMTYDWDLHKIMNGIYNKEKNAEDIIDHIKKDKKRFPDYAFRMQFTDNHDENTWNGTVFERLGNAAETFAVLTYLIPGMPLIYSGQEAGNNKRLEFFEKDPIEWLEHPFFELYKNLNDLRKNNKALWSGTKGGGFCNIPNSQPEAVLMFTREKDDNKLLAVFNLSPNFVEVELETAMSDGSYKEIFTNSLYEWGSSAKRIKLKPWDYKVYLKL